MCEMMEVDREKKKNKPKKWAGMWMGVLFARKEFVRERSKQYEEEAKL